MGAEKIKGIVDGFIDFAKNFGLFETLLIALLVAHYAIIYWLMKQIIKSKDKEIDRLVESRNKLQKVILKHTRLSTKGGKK